VVGAGGLQSVTAANVVEVSTVQPIRRSLGRGSVVQDRHEHIHVGFGRNIPTASIWAHDPAQQNPDQDSAFNSARALDISRSASQTQTERTAVSGTKDVGAKALRTGSPHRRPTGMYSRAGFANTSFVPGTARDVVTALSERTSCLLQTALINAPYRCPQQVATKLQALEPHSLHRHD
jgi:hypothetical protein